MSTITGTAVVPPELFDLRLVGRVGEQIAKQLDSARRGKQRENERKLRDARHQARHEVELMAVEHARAMMERDLYAAIELEKTDPALAAKLRGRIMDRAIGKVPAQDEESVAKRKGVGPTDLIEFLQAVSGASNRLAGIGHTPGAAVPGHIEHDITPAERADDADDKMWFEQYPSSNGGDDHE